MDADSISDSENIYLEQSINITDVHQAGQKMVKQAFPQDTPPSLEKTNTSGKAQVEKKLDDRESPETLGRKQLQESEPPSLKQQGPIVMEADSEGDANAQSTSNATGSHNDAAEAPVQPPPTPPQPDKNANPTEGRYVFVSCLDCCNCPFASSLNE